jgi:hypothetical protein
MHRILGLISFLCVQKASIIDRTSHLLFFKFVLELGKGQTRKKAKAEPSREEMHAVVVEILKEVDFNTVSSAFM